MAQSATSQVGAHKLIFQMRKEALIKDIKARSGSKQPTTTATTTTTTTSAAAGNYFLSLYLKPRGESLLLGDFCANFSSS